jgi:hypothetical protein
VIPADIVLNFDHLTFFSNGDHLKGRAVLSDIILKEDLSQIWINLTMLFKED